MCIRDRVEVIPENLEKALLFKSLHFFHISTDSLNRLIDQLHIQEIEIYSNDPFQVYQNSIPEITNHFQARYPNEIFFLAAPMEQELIKSTSFHTNPRINTIQKQIQQLTLESIEFNNAIAENQYYLNELEKQFQTENNLPRKERLYQEIRTIQKIKLPNDPQPKILELQNKLNELLINDRIKYQTSVADTLVTIPSISPNGVSGKINYILLPTKQK